MFRKRHALKKKEAKKILEELEQQLGCKIDGEVEIAEYKDMKCIFINKKFHALLIDGKPFLTVAGLRKYKASKRFVCVDDGAIKFIINGADVMAPGIIDADESIKEGDMVWIKDERNSPIAIGRALMNGEEMKRERKGKAVKNLHYLGDEIWKMSTEL